MEKFLIYIMLAIIGNYGCTDCLDGNGEQTKTTQKTEIFSKIRINTSADIILKQGDSSKVIIAGYENLVNNIELKSRQDKVIIDDETCVGPNNNVEITLFFKHLEDIELNGSGEVRTHDILKTEELDVEINGSGQITLLLYSDELSFDIDGSGEIKLMGTAEELDIEISGSGAVNAEELLTDNSDIDIKGSGECYVNVQKILKASINGSGKIYYSGMVEDISTDVSGSGTITRKK